jgi:hypothetical protein
LEPAQRLQMLQRIAPMASGAAELRLLISAAADLPDPASLRLVADLLDGEARQEAAMAAVKLADALWHSEGQLVEQTLLRAMPLLIGEEQRARAGALALRASNLASLLKPDSSELAGAIDGNPQTWWSGEAGQPEHRLGFSFDSQRHIGAIGIVGYAHHDRAPRDLQIWADGRLVKNLKNAIYVENLLWEETPGLRARAIELRITRWYGQSPIIRELRIAPSAPGPGPRDP